MVGGITKDIVLRNLYFVDENLSFEEAPSMKTARYSSQLALLNDKFIFVTGGQTVVDKNKYTNSCEMFDIENNKWFPVESMNKPRSNSSMSAVSNRFVFIFSGLSPSVQPSSTNSIEFIDLGNFDAPAVRNAKWEGLVV